MSTTEKTKAQIALEEIRKKMWQSHLYRPKTYTTEPIELLLDLCPSVNSAWRNVQGQGRVRTEHYKRWFNQAIAEIYRLQPPGILGQWECELRFSRPNRGCDVDNRIKPTLDLISNAIVEDDRYCVALSARWDDEVPAGKMIIRIRSA